MSTVPSSSSVCLVRFHDGRARANWGGRATSLALGRLIEESSRFHLTSVINGAAITAGFGDPAPVGLQARLFASGLRRAGASHTTVREARARALRRSFTQIDEDADVLLRREGKTLPSLEEVVDALSAADEVWVNGEGDFILSSSRVTLRRCLLIMSMAHRLGKPVRLLNSILSEHPTHAMETDVVSAVGLALGRCASVSFRDPASLRLHRRLYPGVSATWMPDALFLWARDGEAMLSMDWRTATYGPQTEALGSQMQRLLGSGDRFVAISGSSNASSAERGSASQARLSKLAVAVDTAGFVPVVVATCAEDSWMLRVAKSLGIPSVEARVPLAAGLAVLSRASCLVSGRYHPSILAAVCGTPLLLMTSNSHKTRSLQEVLGSTHSVEWPFLDSGESDVTALTNEVCRRAAEHELLRQTLADRMESLTAAIHNSIELSCDPA